MANLLKVTSIIVTFVFLQTNAQHEIQPNCISSLIDLINQEELILMVHSGYPPDYFSKNLKPSVIINIRRNLNNISEKVWKFHFYLIIIEEVEDLENFFKSFHRKQSWDPHARFLVVSLNNLPNQEIFRLAWKYLVANLSVMDGNYDFYTYFPYADKECGSTKVIKKISDCQQLNNIETLFPSKVLSNYKGCPMRVIYLIIPPFTIDIHAERNPGFEIIILREIAAHFNFTINYVSHKHPFWGHKLPNGTLTMMYGMMVSNKSEIMIGLMSVNSTFNYDIDSVDGHLEEYGTFYVPTALPIEPWRNFTLVFGKLTWSLILVSIILVSSMSWLGGKTGDRRDEYKTLVDWIFRTLCILLASFNAHPKMYSTYQGTLTSFLTKPTYEHQIETLEEMVDAGLSYGGTEIVRPAFYEPDNPLFIKIYHNYQLCPVTPDCVNRTAFKRDFGVVRNFRQIIYLTPKYYTLPNGRSMLYGFKKIITRYLLRLGFVKGYPLFKGIDTMMLRIRDSGLLYKWDEDEQGARKGTILSNDVVVVLTVSHLKVAFFAVVIGSSVASAIFIAELSSLRVEMFDVIFKKWLR